MSNFSRNGRWIFALMVMAAASVVNAAESLVKFSNGEVITEQDLSAYLDKRVDLRASARHSWGVETVLREMALTRTLVLEGERLAEPRNPAKGHDPRFDDIYAHTIFGKLNRTCEPPADAAAARKFFDEHPQAFRVPPMARLSRVMLPAAEMVDSLPAQAWMHMAAKSIATGSRTFDDAAKYAAQVYKLEPQGDLGWVTLVDETSIMRALASAREGELVGPVREGDFAYLFSVLAKREARQLSWDEVAVSVPTRAVQYCRQESSAQLRGDLFKKYGVELDQAAIKGLFKTPSEK